MYRQGGLVPLLDAVREAEPRALEFRGGAQLMGMIGLALGVGFKFLVEPRQLSRFYGLSSLRQLRIAAWIAPALLMTTFMCMLPVGFLSHAYVPEQQVRDAAGKIDTDKVVPYLLSEADVLGPVLGAFFLTGLIAAAMSSLDSVLLVVAATTERDIVGVLRGEAAEATELSRTRVWVAVFALFTAVVALRPPDSIVGLTVLSGSIYAACFVPALLLGLFWRRGNGTAVLVSFGAGLLVLLGWPYLSVATTVHEIFPAVAISTMAYAGIAARRPQVDSGALDRLFA